jgi:hypothetical protein
LRSFFISFVKKNDETLPIINKSKHPKKKGERNTKNKKEGPKSKKTIETIKEGEPQMEEHQVLEPSPLLFARSISNKERGRSF